MEHIIRTMTRQYGQLINSLKVVEQMHQEYIDASGEEDSTMDNAIKALEALIEQVESNIKLASSEEEE
jgi:hypothetical protein